MIDFIFALGIPYLPLLFITTRSSINLRFLSYFSCKTNPCTHNSVLVTVPAHGPGAFDGGWKFLEVSCISNQEHVEPHLLDVSRHKSVVGPNGRPPST